MQFVFFYNFTKNDYSIKTSTPQWLMVSISLQFYTGFENLGFILVTTNYVSVEFKMMMEYIDYILTGSWISGVNTLNTPIMISNTIKQ